jgi:Fe-S-cluster-containing hydrogenase component 2
MAGARVVWVEDARCTGCGACVEVCPAEAITLVEGQARVDEVRCTGCEVCVTACPEDAIQPVIEGELVPAPERPSPVVRRPPGPLTEAAGTAIVVAGVGLLTRAAGTLGRLVLSPLERRPTASDQASVRGSGAGGAGRRARHRRRGRSGDGS